MTTLAQHAGFFGEWSSRSIINVITVPVSGGIPREVVVAALIPRAVLNTLPYPITNQLLTSSH